MQRIQHVIWDWNGTLLDDLHACVTTINRMLGRRSLPLLDSTRYREVFGFPVQDCYRVLGFDLESEDWDDISREFHAIYEETSSSSGLRDGVIDVLDQIRQRGSGMSVLSACERNLLARMLHSRGVAHAFHRVYGLSNLYAASKVDLGRELLRELDIPPSGVVLVGDTTHDFDVSVAIGCRCVLMAGGHQPEWKLKQCGCPVVSGPHHLLEALPPWNGLT
jgi:phosphoglycolate phosphatase